MTLERYAFHWPFDVVRRPDRLILDISAMKRVKGKFVNLVDLVDKGKTGLSVTQFDNLEELRTYTISTGKCFAKESAYAGGVLKLLLREILNKHESGTTHRRA